MEERYESSLIALIMAETHKRFELEVWQIKSSHVTLSVNLPGGVTSIPGMRNFEQRFDNSPAMPSVTFIADASLSLNLP
jgi:hypothetical protein